MLGADVFGPAYPEPAGQFPQYDAVGKVRVDPNNSNIVVAGTKKGLFFSYDAGANWTGPCTDELVTPTSARTSPASTLTNIGAGATRIIAAVGVRGFATPVQYDLGNNGANGIYRGTMTASGCPDFTPITSNANGFVFGTQVTGSPYATGASLNAGSGSPYVNPTAGNQLGRIDLAVAPSNPNVIYAQVQSIAAELNSGCGNANGCQLGVCATTNGGDTWSFMTGSAGGSLRNCGNGLRGDYPQNWYDQAVAVDPNNPDRVFISTFDIWFATRTGTSFYDLTAATTARAATTSSTSTSTRSRSCRARPACSSRVTTAASTGRRTRTPSVDHAADWSTWTAASTRSSSTRATSAATSPPPPPRRQTAARRTTARCRSPSAATRRALCNGRWAPAATASSAASTR